MSQARYNPPYAHIPVPDAPDGVNRALDQIARDLQGLVNTPVVPTLSRSPQRLVTGMIVFADGVNWDPGFGRGYYGYDADFRLSGVASDGALVGTLPNWAPVGDYQIQFLFRYLASTPATPQAIIGNALSGNPECYIRLDGDRFISARHGASAAGQIGTVRSLQPLSPDTTYVISFAVATDGRITVAVNDIVSTETFNYGGPPSGFSRIFSSSGSGAADGTLAISRLIMNTVGTEEIRRYLFEDGTTGVIADSGEPGGEDGTWNAIDPSNVIEIRGAWVALFT